MKIVFFTGAGISKESGLDTFRDKGGIWDQYNPSEVCSVKGYSKNRKAVLDFHNKVRAAVDQAQPNAAHRAIASLEQTHEVVVVTQNIDNLHERAGSTNVIKVHGDIYKAKLKRYRTQNIDWLIDIEEDSHPEGWEQCKGTMRHDVVLFGEQVKKGRQALSEITTCNALVVCGTSLEVYPAAGWIQQCTAMIKIIVDPNPRCGEFDFTHIIAKSASEGIVEAIELVQGSLVELADTFDLKSAAKA